MQRLARLRKTGAILTGLVVGAFGLATIGLAIWGGIGRLSFVPLSALVLVLLAVLVMPESAGSA
jgi:hypothetical protein